MEAAAVAAVVRQAQEEAVEEASQDELQLSNIDVDLALALGETSPSVIDAEADAVFEATDLDGDGTISFSELSYHMSAVGYSSTVISLAFGVLDTDLDGSVSPAELRNCFHRFESSALRIALGLAVGRQSSTLESPEEGDVRSALAEEMFSMLDEDGDGAISPAELRGHLMAKGYARSLPSPPTSLPFTSPHLLPASPLSTPPASLCAALKSPALKPRVAGRPSTRSFVRSI